MAATDRLFVDLIAGVTNANLNGTDGTTLSGAFLADLPEVADPEYVAITLDPNGLNGAPEIVWVTAHTAEATTATIEREKEGTTKRSHDSGTEAAAALTAQAIADLYQAVEDAETNLTNSVQGAVSSLGQAIADAVEDLEEAEGVLGAAVEAVEDVTPTGAIVIWPSDTPPDGWLICDGDAVSRSTYSALFGVVGESFGEGDGETTFNLPDFRGRFPFGVAASGTGDSLADEFGSIDHVHTGPSHSHGAGTLAASSGGAHTHDISTHTHAVDPPNTSSTAVGDHTHGANHSHETNTAGSHTHSFSDSFTTGQASTGSNVASGSNTARTTVNHTHSGSVSGTTGSSGSHDHFVHTQSVTTTGAGGHSHNVNIGSFSSGGSGTLSTQSDGAHTHDVTGSTGAEGTGNTGAGNPPGLAIHFIIRTGVVSE